MSLTDERIGGLLNAAQGIGAAAGGIAYADPVSYTHLPLPTILLV